MCKLKSSLQIMLLVAGLIEGSIVSAGGHGSPGIATPTISKAALHKDRNAIVISGQNFGSTPPTVILANQELEVKRFSQQEIVASLPPGSSAATYRLTVTSNGQNRAISDAFNVALPEVDRSKK